MMTTSAVVKLACQSLTHYLQTGQVMAPPVQLDKEMTGKAGVFVSLKKQGELRGCIGTFAPTKNTVAEEIIANAVSAGTQDPRFHPVTLNELPEITISVDILNEPERVDSLEVLDPQRYGVIVRRGRRSGLLLPMLEGVDTPEYQVSIAMQKAGISPGEEIELYRFTVTRYL